MSPFFPQTALYISHTSYKHKINTIHLTILSVCLLRTLRSLIGCRPIHHTLVFRCGIVLKIYSGNRVEHGVLSHFA